MPSLGVPATGDADGFEPVQKKTNTWRDITIRMWVSLLMGLICELFAGSNYAFSGQTLKLIRNIYICIEMCTRKAKKQSQVPFFLKTKFSSAKYFFLLF